jgi:hypothetical protein
MADLRRSPRPIFYASNNFGRRDDTGRRTADAGLRSEAHVRQDRIRSEIRNEFAGIVQLRHFDPESSSVKPFGHVNDLYLQRYGCY